jgi:hypothetical protein
MELQATVLMLIALSAHTVAGNVSQHRVIDSLLNAKNDQGNICIGKMGFALRFNSLAFV